MVLHKKIVNQSKRYDLLREAPSNKSHSEQLRYLNMQEVFLDEKVHNFNRQEIHFIYFEVILIFLHK